MNRKKQYILIVAILWISCCLRAPITGVGPMIGVIRADLGLGNSAAGMLTTIPLLAFALVSLFVGELSSRFQAGYVMLLGLVATGIGILCRSYMGMGGLFAGTIVIGIGIAVGNVLIPAFVKACFPEKTGIMTGVYTSLMAIFSGIAGAISVPLYYVWGWKNALAVWIFLLVAAIFLWLPNRSCTLERRSAEPAVRGSRLFILARDSMTWWVSAYMGVQSLIFYCFVAWFAVIVQSKGFDAQTAGYFNSVYMLTGIPGSLILPVIFDRWKNRSSLAVVMGVLYMGGIVTLILARSTLTLASALVCCGFCAGATLSFAMLLFVMHTSSAADASALSGLAQSIGYIMAAAGPVCMGRLYDAAGSWTLPLATLLLMAAILTVAGFLAGKERIIGERGRLYTLN